MTYFSLLLSKVISAEELFFLIRGKQEENIYVRKSALQSFSLISTAGRVLSKLTSSMKEDKQSTVNHHDSSSTNISLQLSSLIKRISKNGHLAVLCFTERNKLIELGTCPCTRGGKKNTWEEHAFMAMEKQKQKLTCVALWPHCQAVRRHTRCSARSGCGCLASSQQLTRQAC